MRRRWLLTGTTLVLAAGLLADPAAAQISGRQIDAPAGTQAGGSWGRGGFDLQAHRGGLGLRTESTLSSFGNALRLGVSTLELDLQITEDGHAVVTHDRRVDGRKWVTPQLFEVP